MVDHNEDDFNLVRRAMMKNQSDLRLERVANGDGVFPKIANEPQVPVVLLLEAKLPGRAGQEVLRELRSESTLRHLPVVMFTGSPDPKDLSEAYKLGCNAYIQKPFNYSEFVDVIGSVIAFWTKVEPFSTPFDHFTSPN